MPKSGSRAQRIPLAELGELIQRLQGAVGIERAALARRLSAMDGPTLVTLQAVADEAVADLKEQRNLTEAALARELGYPGRSAVHDAIKRHRDRSAGVVTVRKRQSTKTT